MVKHVILFTVEFCKKLCLGGKKEKISHSHAHRHISVHKMKINTFSGDTQLCACKHSLVAAYVNTIRNTETGKHIPFFDYCKLGFHCNIWNTLFMHVCTDICDRDVKMQFNNIA